MPEHPIKLKYQHQPLNQDNGTHIGRNVVRNKEGSEVRFYYKNGPSYLIQNKCLFARNTVSGKYSVFFGQMIVNFTAGNKIDSCVPSSIIYNRPDKIFFLKPDIQKKVLKAVL